MPSDRTDLAAVRARVEEARANVYLDPTMSTDADVDALVAAVRAERDAEIRGMFTREDVQVLRSYDYAFYGNDSIAVELDRESCEQLQALASRIEAILPPEDAAHGG